MTPRLLRTILLLPGTVLVFVPAALLWLTAGTWFGAALAAPATLPFWVAIGVGLPALGLMGWTVGAFTRFGEGTPAPWDPPKKLVVRGVYRHVRNPMISGVALMLLAETLILGSPAIALWLGAFVLANLVYIPSIEERGLERRFGAHYRRYQANVPRWIPRFSPWRDPAE